MRQRKEGDDDADDVDDERVSELEMEDLVLAKVKGFPAWPAKVSRPQEWGRTPVPNKTFIQFFGTHQIYMSALLSLKVYLSTWAALPEAKKKVLADDLVKRSCFSRHSLCSLCVRCQPL